VAEIDGVTVVPPDRARVDGEEGDAVHAAPMTAVAIRTVTTRALGCPIVFLLAPKSHDALRREPSALSTKTSQRATTSPPRRQTSQSVWPSSRTAHLVGHRPNPRAREYEPGRSGCARSRHTTRPRSRLCPNAVITRPPTRPSESSGDSMRPRRHQSAGVGILGSGVPTHGSDGIRGEPMGLLARSSHPPRNAYPGFDRSEHVRGSGPPAGRRPWTSVFLSPEDDRQVFERPEFKAMFAWPPSVGSEDSDAGGSPEEAIPRGHHRRGTATPTREDSRSHREEPLAPGAVQAPRGLRAGVRRR